MQLTKNFSLEEMTYSDTAKKHKIFNQPTQAEISNLKKLCENVLQPLRDYLKCPITVTSGYRCLMLNKVVGGVSNSQHLTGEAVDIQVKNKDLKEVFNYIKNNLQYDQLLFEKSSKTTWIHVSYRHLKNRHQAISNYQV